MTNYLRWFSPKSKNGHFEEMPYKDGLVFEDNLSEDLDSGTIIINKTSKKDFEPFDIVEIVNNNFSKKTMLIDSVVENQVSFDPVLYDYTLSLMSKTKELERIVLPNFSITRPIYDDGSLGTALTLSQVINNLLTDYAPKYFIGGNYVKPYTLVSDSRLNVSCPDMQMSKPTLREAIDRILSVIHCICRLDNHNVIQIVDINKKNNEIDLETNVNLNYQHENQSSGDYASTLDNTYNNVVPSSSIDGIIDNSEITEFIGFRDEPNGIVSEDNLFLQTKYPIYNIKHVSMYCTIWYEKQSSVANQYCKFDITDFVVEASKYCQLPFGDTSYKDSHSRPIPTTPSQINTVHYVRGSNKIEGWTNNYKKVFTTYFAIDLLASAAAELAFGPLQNVNTIRVVDARESCAFEITYAPQVESIRTKTGKLLPETHENSEIIDNPSEAYVDIHQQGKLFNEKVNRLGNRAKIITGRFPVEDLADMPQLGDFLGNFKVISIETQYYDDFVIYKAILTENFVNINYFTGINARRRSWQIVDAGEAFDKQLLEKYYCEFSFSAKYGQDNTIMSHKSQNVVLYNMLNQHRIEMHLANFMYRQDNPYKLEGLFLITNGVWQYADFVELEFQAFVSGNSIVINSGMLDNFSATVPSIIENQTIGINFWKENGGYVEYYNYYTDGLGKADSFSLFFITKHGREKQQSNYYGYIPDMEDGNAWDITNDHPLPTPAGATKPAVYLYQGYKPRVYWENKSSGRPYMSGDDLIFSLDINNHKDSREIINFNIQFEYCTDTKNIVFTEEFIKRVEIIRDDLTLVDYDYEVWVSDEEYNSNDTGLKGNREYATSSVNLEFQNNGVNGCAKFTIYGSSTPHKSVVVVSKIERKLILAVNTTEQNPVIYMNLLKNRDRKNYNYSNMKTWDNVDPENYYYEEIQDISELDEDVECVLGWRDRETGKVYVCDFTDSSITDTNEDLGYIEYDTNNDGTLGYNQTAVDSSITPHVNSVVIKKRLVSGESEVAYGIYVNNLQKYLYNATGTSIQFISEIMNGDYISSNDYAFNMTMKVGRNVLTKSNKTDNMLTFREDNKFVFETPTGNRLFLNVFIKKSN